MQTETSSTFFISAFHYPFSFPRSNNINVGLIKSYLILIRDFAKRWIGSNVFQNNKRTEENEFVRTTTIAKLSNQKFEIPPIRKPNVPYQSKSLPLINYTPCTVPRIFSPNQRSNESITSRLHLQIYTTRSPNSISKRFHGDSGPRITQHGRLASNGFTAAENIGISIRRFVF